MKKLKHGKMFDVVIVAIFVLGLSLVGFIGFVGIKLIKNPEIIGGFLGKIINSI